MLKLLVCGDQMYRSNAVLYLHTFVSCPVYSCRRIAELFREFAQTLYRVVELSPERTFIAAKNFFREEIEGTGEFESVHDSDEVCIVECSSDYKLLSNMKLDKSHILLRVVSKGDARSGHIFLPGDIGDDTVDLPIMFLSGDNCPSILISIKKLIISLKSAKYFDYYTDTDVLVSLFEECVKAKKH